ncbi:CASTOR/POLLUX-related putative ion channel [Marinobacter mobilis]|uniref:Trk K+ transport system, NAD-binding component n=1 Tax=Marinobacter mobilis TaxID=488533 RepID=A0A1H2QES1_9GAMM|nr:TrkA C-terminal domain-containing protein [Marinobacter mobilis]SDW05773.1 Trk K+ transport system, NAD-binding component [Marinobacter mobilis]
MLPLRFIDRLKFFVERQFVRGAAFQLVIVAMVIGLISLAGGLLVAPVDGAFDSLGAAVWWAFLRLTDPGYLGDDAGNWQRFVSTLLTLLGYVVFLGALVAILTRWLIALMNNLERGLTPVSLRNHVVVLGWTPLTLPLVAELLEASPRVRRFLELNDARRLRLVVLAEEVSARQALELSNEPDIGRKARQVILRSGLAIQPEALERVACLDAAAVIIPGTRQETDGLVTSDVETVKALLSIAAQARQRKQSLPFVVAELRDPRKQRVIEKAYPGAVEVVAGDATISRLIVKTVLHPGISELYTELLTASEGNQLYLRSGETAAGLTLAELAGRRSGVRVLGLMRRRDSGWETRLLAPADTVIEAGDRVVMLARRYEHTDTDTSSAAASTLSVASAPPARAVVATSRRILILGWSRKVPVMLAEFNRYAACHFDIDVVSVVPLARREGALTGVADALERVKVRQIEADYLVDGELRRLQPADYDSVILMSNDRLATEEEADARAMMGFLLLEDLLATQSRRPQVIQELSDPDNEALLGGGRSEILISPMILSHLLAQVALRRELRQVLDELFGHGGAEFQFRAPEAYGLTASASFQDCEAAAAERGEMVLGLFHHRAQGNGRRLELNPPAGTLLDLQAGDRLVVLAMVG